MRHPFVLPPGWYQVPQLVGHTGPKHSAEGVLPGQWDASRLVRAISDGTFPKPLPIPNHFLLLGWPRGAVIEWLRANPQ